MWLSQLSVGRKHRFVGNFAQRFLWNFLLGQFLLAASETSFVPNMVMWWPTCNYNTCTRVRHTSFLILLMMDAWRPKHVEWLRRNKTWTVLHQVGVLFDLYYDARKHKSKVELEGCQQLTLGAKWKEVGGWTKLQDWQFRNFFFKRDARGTKCE